VAAGQLTFNTCSFEISLAYETLSKEQKKKLITTFVLKHNNYEHLTTQSRYDLACRGRWHEGERKSHRAKIKWKPYNLVLNLIPSFQMVSNWKIWSIRSDQFQYFSTGSFYNFLLTLPHPMWLFYAIKNVV
jgi:hypothetical protein